MKQQIYDPIAGEQVFDSIMAKARKTNRSRDQTDRGSGFAAPGDTTLEAFLRNAIMAISVGLNTRQQQRKHPWECVAEGLDMLQQAELRGRIIPAAGKG